MVNTSSTEILMNIVIWADDIIQQMVLQTTFDIDSGLKKSQHWLD